ncbi:ABC transporter permease [Lysinibacillus xylanilyticus]|uniref:ABC transporter permease n=1 Tax=Lysinibacillus xylanilyticus TaxID=582475 RepID=A0ABT4EIA3_9BACI|nr:ABC transporter permease [Lysinibacillus xylanilyticus]MCY9545381.1 ABC transporter permease [Lysinibacillus xylanilyticus]
MTILSNSIKRIFRKRTNILFMLVIPILMNLFLISAATKDVKYNLGILDQDSTPFTKELVSKMQEKYNVTLLTPSDDVKDLIVNKKLDIAFTFQSGFTADMLEGKDVAAISYALEASNVARPVQVYVSSYISSAKQIATSAKGNEDVFYKGLEAYNKNAFAVEYKSFSTGVSEKDVNNAVTSLGYIAFGMLFLISFSTSLILEDKLTGVYDRITATPLTRSSYFSKHMLASFLVAAIQVLLLISSLPKLVDISYGSTSNQQLEVIAVCLALALACVAIGVAISRFSKSALMASSLTALINIPMLMLGGCFWPREIMPDFMQRISDFMPTTWFLQAGETVLYGKGLNGAIPELSYLIGFAALLLIVTFAVKSEKVR